MLTNEDTDIIKKYLPIGVIIFILVIILSFVYQHYATKGYNSISTKDVVIGKVVYTEKIDRSKIIMLENGQKFILPYASNENYNSSSLISIVGKGDFLVKRAGSDTMLVKKLHGEYLFVIGTHIKVQ